MADPLICIAAGTLLSKAADAAFSGVIGNRIDALFCSAVEHFAGPMWEEMRNGQNHDLEKGILKVHQKTITDLAKACDRISLNGEQKSYAKRLLDLATTDLSPNGKTTAEFQPLLTTILCGPLKAGDDRYEMSIKQVVMGLIDHYELLLAASMPDNFKSVFLEGTAREGSWEGRFRFHLAQYVKSKEGERFEKIFSMQTLAAVLERQISYGEIVERLDGSLKLLHNKQDYQTQLLEQIRDTQLAQTAKSNGVTDAALIELARLVTDKYIDDPQQAFLALKDAIERLIDLEAQANGSGNLEASLQIVISEINERTKQGRFQEALDYGSAAYEEEKQASKARQLTLIEANLSTALIGQNVDVAVKWVIEHLKIEHEIVTFSGLSNTWKDWYVRGRDKGLYLDLDISIGLARQVLNLSKSSEERTTAYNNLGLSLRAFGVLTRDADCLEEAVFYFRLSIRECNQKLMPLDWAMAQNNLGNALQSLGDRENGNERLEEAIVAFRAALQEYRRDIVPLSWAATQNNLGNALHSLGIRQSGTHHLVEAVTAYQAALEEHQRDIIPLEWAATQNNLGNALQSLGEREMGTGRLEEAVVAYRAALEERRREIVPLEWAGTQFNLSLVFRILYIKNSDRVNLAFAIRHAKAAHEFYEEAKADYWVQYSQSLIEDIMAM